MKMFALVQLVGWDKPMWKPVHRIEFNENDVVSVTIDFGKKTIPRYITYRKGTEAWDEVIRKLSVEVE